MKLIAVDQGSAEWREARLGVPTASQFHRIVTPKTLKLSASADGYLAELLAEWALGAPLDDQSSGFMERGKDMEAEAVRWYEFTRERDTEPGGFCLREDIAVGCSPDRLVGGDGGLEVKCPSAGVHVGYLLGHDADKYRLQVQGGMLVTGRLWWDWVSYHPDLPPVLVRHERDEECVGALLEALGGFVARLEEGRARLRDLGVLEASERSAARAEAKRLDDARWMESVLGGGAASE